MTNDAGNLARFGRRCLHQLGLFPEVASVTNGSDQQPNRVALDLTFTGPTPQVDQASTRTCRVLGQPSLFGCERNESACGASPRACSRVDPVRLVTPEPSFADDRAICSSDVVPLSPKRSGDFAGLPASDGERDRPGGANPDRGSQHRPPTHQAEYRARRHQRQRVKLALPSLG